MKNNFWLKDKEEIQELKIQYKQAKIQVLIQNYYRKKIKIYQI